MTDNGSQFTSEDFANFVKSNGIQHSLSSPYHPASNGEAERFVRTFKEAMKTSKNNGLTLAHRMNNFLLTYRTTPHSTTGTPPSELLMGRALRTRWDIIKPDVGQRVCWRQAKQKEGKDQNTKLRHFVMGQSVMVKNFCTGPTWVPGIIAQQLGPLTYMIEISAGKFWKRHVDHVKDYPSKGLSSAPVNLESDNNEDDEFFAPLVRGSNEETNAASEEGTTPTTIAPAADPELTSASGLPTSGREEQTSRRYPERQHQAPSRYGINYSWTSEGGM